MKKRKTRLQIIDELGYPRWMDLPLSYWPEAELRDWLLGAFGIVNPLERYLEKTSEFMKKCEENG